jgi:hypothetical protein
MARSASVESPGCFAANSQYGTLCALERLFA